LALFYYKESQNKVLTSIDKKVNIYTGGDRMLTRKELAEKLNMSERTIDRHRKNGMPFIKIGKSIRFEYVEVLKWIKEGN